MIERRFINKASIRSAGDWQASRTVEGHAATFGTLSSDLGGFREKIAVGAFARSIGRGDDVRCLQNHDASLLLGRTKNKTLELSEDSVGLRFRCLLPQTSYANDLLESVQRGDCDEMSFGFFCDPDGDSWEDGYDPDDGSRCAIRTLRSVRLTDVSIVTFAAYPGTNVIPPGAGFNLDARSIFPEGVPQEVRSHAPNAGSIAPFNTRQRRLHQFILG
jgi:uncharacterized protein